MLARSAAVILVDHDGKFLFQHRSDDAPSNPGLWGFFGGQVEAGEEPIEAACREAMEELGYDLVGAHCAHSAELNLKSRKLLVDYFLAPITPFSALSLNEGQSLGWFSLADALKLELTVIARAFVEALCLIICHRSQRPST